MSLALGAKEPEPDPGYESHTIEGSKCANGKPLVINVKRQDPSKVLIYLRGGGACWNYNTCFGRIPLGRTELKPPSFQGIIDTSIEGNPFKDYSIIYINYCTADLHSGKHQVTYRGSQGKKREVFHWGRRNVELSFKYLFEEARLTNNLEKAVFYGESAGALGALLNMDLADAYVQADSKLFVADSPGLHFKDNIWSRFDDKYTSDLFSGMDRNGIDLPEDEGIIASKLQGFCHKYNSWKVGILQGTRDWLMTYIFGRMLPADHEKMVWGERGLHQVFSDPSDHCSSWTPKSGQHTFLRIQKGWNVESSTGVSAIDYMKELLSNQSGEQPSYR